MLIALGVLAVTSLLAAAVYVAVLGDVNVTQHDLEGKRAYYAASAGVNAYLYQLNQHPDYWKTCSNDTQAKTAVPGSTTGEQYAYQPVYNQGYSSANCSGSEISAMIESTTGTLRMEFMGYSGTPQVSRGIVASFRKSSPLDFLWYTVYEALDSSISGYSGCNVFYRNGRSSLCNINWVSGDVINGPMYTQDQYLIWGSPTFGRNQNDRIESAAPGSSPAAICAGNNCGSANIKGTAVPNAGTIPIPSDNSQLLTDAANHGQVYSGTTTIALNGTTATVTTCPSTSSSAPCNAPVTVNFPQGTIIYVQNASGCTPSTYSPFGAGYPTNSSGNYYGCSGDVYVSGSYTAPLTIAAANNVIIDGNLTTSEDGSGTPNGNATLGLVANEFIRVMHGVTARNSNSFGDCGSATDIPSQTFKNLKIDAAILGLQHSFIVDNFDCGNQLGNLIVNGAIAQYFRGAVGTTAGTGYLKNYTYDSRLAVLLPPYLFDIASSGWHIVRETLCVPGGGDPNTACQ